MAEDRKPDTSAPSATPSAPFREWLLERTGTLIAGCLSALAVLAYPAGLITLWIQMKGYYGFDHWTALYAASFVPPTLVVGKIATVVYCSFLTSVAVWMWCMFGWGYRAYHRATYNMEGNPFGLVDPDKPKGRYTTLGQLIFSHERAGAIGMVLIMPVVFYPSFFPTSLFDLGVYAAYLVLVAVGSYVSTPLLIGALTEESRPRLYKAMVVACAASIVAAVPLVGLASPALPTVEMTWEGQKQEVSQLSHADGYWHIIDGDGAIVSVPDDEVEGPVKVTGTTQKPGY